jgi:hypothetical protein
MKAEPMYITKRLSVDETYTEKIPEHEVKVYRRLMEKVGMTQLEAMAIMHSHYSFIGNSTLFMALGTYGGTEYEILDNAKQKLKDHGKTLKQVLGSLMPVKPELPKGIIVLC